MIPNVVHIIFGLKEDFGDKSFSFIHYLTIKSAYECNKPDAIKFYYKYEPHGEWWDRAKGYLTLVKIESPQEIFGHPLLHYAHQTDVLRLEILIKEGGIYLDIDVLCLNSFAPLRKHKCVMGMEENHGLCNAIILAEPNAEFLRICYEEYRTFRSKGKDEYWGEHSVVLPLKNAKLNPGLVHIEDKFSFFWPNFINHDHTLWDTPTADASHSVWLKLKKWITLKFIGSSYCVHLWEQLWWDKYLKSVSPEYIKRTDNVFAALCRNLLFLDQQPHKTPSGNISFFRPMIKKLIRSY